MKEEKLVEIARSFSYKLNVGNYESRDFFCSQKAEVPESQAVETSEKLYQFCKGEVMRSVAEYKANMSPVKPAKKGDWKENINARENKNQEAVEELTQDDINEKLEMAKADPDYPAEIPAENQYQEKYGQ